MSFFGINVAGSALEAYQTAENVTSQNIADVSVTGASRQIVNFTEAPPVDGSPNYPGNFSPGTQGTGVLVASITRVHQDSYDALFRGATSSQNYYGVESNSLTALQSALGEPANGINAAYSNFQTAVQTLANNPSGIPERSGLLSSAQALVVALNSAGSSITSQQTQVQNQAGSYIATINSTLDQIAALNGQIRASTAVGNSPNTYEDQRDQLIDTLSTYVPVQVSNQADGSVLVTVNGQALVNDTVDYHLASPVVGANPNGTPALIVGFASTPNTAVPISGGLMGGLLDVYNNKLVSYQNSLNSFTSGLALEADRITQSGYDLTGAAGGQLFAPVVTQLPISAGNIQVGISTPSEVPAGLATTAAGTLVQPLNAANNTVDTTAQLNGNTTLNNPVPAAGLTGTLQIADDGIPGAQQTFTYSTAPGGNADTISDFINSFNAGHYGVTASYNSTSQSVVFARDPTNVDLVHRALQAAAGGVTTPSFTITDSLQAAAPPAVLGTPATSLLGALGASAISGVAQTSANAYGTSSGANASALQSLFSTPLGAPALQVSVPIASVVPPPTAGSSVTVTGPAAVPPGTVPPFATVNVGDVLTIYDGNPPSTANEENVTVTAVNRNNNTITFTVKNNHSAAPTLYITSAQTQTLQTYYSNFVAQLGLDTQTAQTGSASQTTLASNINQVRQSTDGINIDEETQNLIKYQNAYAAAAHTIDVLNQMLGVIINLGS
jgi:flagellar hook-associated protein 1 FlgK